jgi:VanZ family protein
MPTEARAWSRPGLYIVGGILFLLFGFGSTPASANLVAEPWDKLVHFGVFACLTVGLRLLLPRVPLTLIIGIALAIAIGDELHQFLVPQRQPGWDDGLADMVGVGGGLLSSTCLRRRFSGPTAAD